MGLNAYIKQFPETFEVIENIFSSFFNDNHKGLITA